jgi:F-type H+-transporting ATPase subunit delta
MARFRALPYAKALFEVIGKKPRAEEVVDELDGVADALEAVPDFQRVLVTPMVSNETKAAILDEVLDRLGVSDITRRFVHVVQQHYRMEHMRSIAELYRELIDRDRGRTRASIEVAGAPDDEQKRQILAAMREVVGTDVVATFEPNPGLLAGFRARVGSKVFDASLAGEVDRLARGAVAE